MWVTTEAQQPFSLTGVEDADAESLMRLWWSTEVLEVAAVKMCWFFPIVQRQQSREWPWTHRELRSVCSHPRLLQQPPSTVGLLKNFWDTPHWWVLFDCSPAWLGGLSPPAIGSCAELAIPAPWLLWTGAKYFFHLSIRGISASGRREARLGECIPHRCGWEAHSKMYIPVSSSGILFLLEGSLLTTGSLLSDCFILGSCPATDGWTSLFDALLWTHSVYRCRQWHVCSNPPAKKLRSSVFSLWRS